MIFVRGRAKKPLSGFLPARRGHVRVRPRASVLAFALSLLCVLTLLFAGAGFAQQFSGTSAPFADNGLAPIVLNDALGGGNLASYAYITRDPDSGLVPSDIIRSHMQNVRGARQSGPLINLGFDPSPAWIVFAVHNNSRDSDWALSFGTRGEGRLGIARNLKLYEAYAGKMLYDTAPVDKGVKPSRISGTQLPLHIAPGATALYLLYWAPEPGRPGTLDLEIRRQGESGLSPAPEDIALYILIGLVGFFAAVAVVTRMSGYITFIVYFVAQAMSLLWFSGTIFPDYHGGGSTLALLSSVSIISGILMARVFIEPGREDFIDNVIVFVLIGTVVFSTLLYLTIVPEYSPVLPVFMYAPPILVLVALIALSFVHAYKGRPGGYAFTLSWIFRLCGIGVSAATFSGYLPVNAVTVNGFALGVFPQAIFLVIACRSKFARDESRRRDAIRQEKHRIEAMARLRQSKDAADQGRLLRVIEREREIMAELREREAQRAEEMRRAKDVADEANRAKSAFLAVVSHEIRTPMTGVMGMVRLLLGSGMSPDQKEYVRTIQDSGDAMLALLNDILDFEKIESGKMELETVDFELGRLVHGVVALMSGHAADKKITIQADLDSGLPAFVRGDPTRLRQVLLNLVNNAIKFTTKGGVTIILRHSGATPGPNGAPRHGIYFAVRDTGVGISGEGQRNLFKPFSQADSSVARKYGGTGLGLAICKRLIEAMGGAIGLDSREGEGSTFHFTLTLNEGQSTDSPGAVAQDRKAPARVMRILVVDDNEINRKVMLGLIGQAGHKAEAVDGGEKAVDICTREKFDLVLMDIEMPGLRGDDATKALRDLPDPDRAATPVIALTGNVRKEDVEKFYRAGMNGFVAKPIDPAALHRALDNAAQGVFDNPLPVAAAASEKEEEKEKTVVAQEEGGEVSFAPAAPPPSPSPATPPQGQTRPIADPGVFDEKLLAGIRNSLSAEQVKELLDGLLVKTDELVVAIGKAVQDDNAAELSARAHELKGMAGNFGLTGISTLAASLEKAAKSGQMEAAGILSADLPSAANQGRAAIEAWMRR